MMDIKKNYQSVCNRIKQAEKACQRQGKVELLAVSKTKPIELIEALVAEGQTRFGENYVQEALTKIAQHPELEWHFIGPIQSNKTRPIAENFAWIHSIDRLKVAQRLNDQRPSSMTPINILLEINISQEASKAGFAPNEALTVAQQISQLPNLKLRGLMCIPQLSHDPQQQTKPFEAMQTLFQQLKEQLPEENIDTLSMGMSGDLEAAIAAGSTCVRIGTDLFGARN